VLTSSRNNIDPIELLIGRGRLRKGRDYEIIQPNFATMEGEKPLKIVP
jgi:hypothetical protein